jgi:hypothetical protein
MGRTWAGIEVGEPPRSTHSFLQYTSAVRVGDVAALQRVERLDGDW